LDGKLPKLSVLYVFMFILVQEDCDIRKTLVQR
jgi:hypothetical protein